MISVIIQPSRSLVEIDLGTARVMRALPPISVHNAPIQGNDAQKGKRDEEPPKGSLKNMADHENSFAQSSGRVAGRAESIKRLK